MSGSVHLLHDLNRLKRQDRIDLSGLESVPIERGSDNLIYWLTLGSQIDSQTGHEILIHLRGWRALVHSTAQYGIVIRKGGLEPSVFEVSYRLISLIIEDQYDDWIDLSGESERLITPSPIRVLKSGLSLVERLVRDSSRGPSIYLISRDRALELLAIYDRPLYQLPISDPSKLIIVMFEKCLSVYPSLAWIREENGDQKQEGLD